ncbi:MAG: hypothetical protein FWD24_08195 [Treponema sp.]|nr:hypothetical protein [Treponema sp.]
MAQDLAVRRKDYLKRKKSGLCPRCGKKIKKSSKFKMCDDCREYFRSYNNEIADSQNEIKRERYALRKAKYCCPRCGIKLGKKSKNIICTACLKKQYKYNTGKKR